MAQHLPVMTHVAGSATSVSSVFALSHRAKILYHQPLQPHTLGTSLLHPQQRRNDASDIVCATEIKSELWHMTECRIACVIFCFHGPAAYQAQDRRLCCGASTTAHPRNQCKLGPRHQAASRIRACPFWQSACLRTDHAPRWPNNAMRASPFGLQRQENARQYKAKTLSSNPMVAQGQTGTRCQGIVWRGSFKRPCAVNVMKAEKPSVLEICSLCHTSMHSIVLHGDM